MADFMVLVHDFCTLSQMAIFLYYLPVLPYLQPVYITILLLSHV